SAPCTPPRRRDASASKARSTSSRTATSPTSASTSDPGPRRFLRITRASHVSLGEHRVAVVAVQREGAGPPLSNLFERRSRRASEARETVHVCSLLVRARPKGTAHGHGVITWGATHTGAPTGLSAPLEAVP